MSNVTLRDYQGAKWDEPIIMTLGTPGERGIIPPEADPKVVEAVGGVDQLMPERIRRKHLRPCRKCHNTMCCNTFSAFLRKPWAWTWAWTSGKAPAP